MNKTRALKRLVLIISAFLLIVSGTSLLSCEGTPPSVSPTPSPSPSPSPTPPPSPEPEGPSYAAKPFLQGIIIGDFSVAVNKIQRGADTAIVWLAIRRVNKTEKGSSALPYRGVGVGIIDDRGNTYALVIGYKGEEGSAGSPNYDISPYVPVGFTWVERCKVNIPSAAPIVKVELASQVTDSSSQVSPDFYSELRDGITSAGEELRISKDLSLRFGKVTTREDRHYDYTWTDWSIPVTVTNEDYNKRTLSMDLGVQYSDGTVLWEWKLPWYGFKTWARWATRETIYGGTPVPIKGLSTETFHLVSCYHEAWELREARMLIAVIEPKNEPAMIQLVPFSLM